MNSANPYPKQTKEAVALLQRLSKELEIASKGKLSTNDKTPDRLLWEIFNKIFTILVTCENALLTKDSLTVHLIARYSYEMLIVFAYVFLDKSKTQERAEQFILFNQFKNTDRMWTDKTYAQMLEALPDKTRFAIHKTHYRNLSNFAHPTMDSFMLNRRGDQSEFLMNLSTLLLTLGTVLEIVRICFEEHLHFTDGEQKLINIAEITTEADQLMKNLRSA
jgi:hypothetical protein